MGETVLTPDRVIRGHGFELQNKKKRRHDRKYFFLAGDGFEILKGIYSTNSIKKMEISCIR